MASASNITEHRRNAQAVADQLSEVSVPKALAPRAKAFRDAQKAFEAAAGRTLEAEAARDAALAEVGAADASLDAAVDALVDRLPGAGLGTRQQPLKAFSSRSPTDLKAMPYAQEPDEVDSVVAKILAKKPPADVVAACKACSQRAADVRAKLKAFGAKQRAYAKALADRDALLPDLTKALSSLKTHAAAAWEADPTTLKSVFAKPGRVEAPRKRRPKKGGDAPG